MSVFHTKFGQNDVLPDKLPTFAGYRPSMVGSTAVGGGRKRKTRKMRKNHKNQKKSKNMKNTRNVSSGKSRWKM